MCWPLPGSMCDWSKWKEQSNTCGSPAVCTDHVLRSLLVPSVAVYIVEPTLQLGFNSFRAHHFQSVSSSQTVLGSTFGSNCLPLSRELREGDGEEGSKNLSWRGGRATSSRAIRSCFPAQSARSIADIEKGAGEDEKFSGRHLTEILFSPHTRRTITSVALISAAAV
jgi:hypothetical protein